MSYSHRTNNSVKISVVGQGTGTPAGDNSKPSRIINEEGREITYNELDMMYDIDHRTQKHLSEVEASIEEIKKALERDALDRQSSLQFKLE